MFESENKQDVDIQILIKDLLDNDQPFPPKYLHAFSDITPENHKMIQEVWSKVDPIRKQKLYKDFVKLASTDTLVSFLDMGHLGIDDEDPVIRAASIRLLEYFDSLCHIDTLINMASNDTEEIVRETAVIFLGNFVYEGELMEIPEQDYAKILTFLFDKYASKDTELVRRRCLEAVSFSANETVPVMIKDALKKSQPWVISAIFSMGRSANQMYKDEVLKFLADDDEEILFEAVKAAGELNLAEARQPILAMIATPAFEEDEIFRETVIWALSEIGGDNVAEALNILLEKCEDEEEAEFLTTALENLELTEGIMGSLSMLEIDEPDLEFGDLDIDDFDPQDYL